MNAKYILSRLRKEADKPHLDIDRDPLPRETALQASNRTTEVDTREALGGDCPELVKRVVELDMLERDSLQITMLEDINGVTGSGTGATLWDSAILLTKYLMLECNMRNQSIIELGAGLGLPSIALAMCGNKVVATERGLTLNMLNQNIGANVISHPTGSIRTMKLDWSENNQHIFKQFNEKAEFNVIVGSDLIFLRNREIWPSLATTFKDLLTGLNTEACYLKKGYLAYENRDKIVIKTFLQLLDERGIIYRLCSSSLFEDWPADISIYELHVQYDGI